MKHTLKFTKDEALNAWHINVVLTYVERGFPFPATYRWNFTTRTGVDYAVEILRSEYHLKARKVKSNNHHDDYFYNIRIRFKDEADEAVFMMRAISDDITLDDDNNTSYYR